MFYFRSPWRWHQIWKEANSLICTILMCCQNLNEMCSKTSKVFIQLQPQLIITLLAKNVHIHLQNHRHLQKRNQKLKKNNNHIHRKRNSNQSRFREKIREINDFSWLDSKVIYVLTEKYAVMSSNLSFEQSKWLQVTIDLFILFHNCVIEIS